MVIGPKNIGLSSPAPHRRRPGCRIAENRWQSSHPAIGVRTSDFKLGRFGPLSLFLGDLFCYRGTAKVLFVW